MNLKHQLLLVSLLTLLLPWAGCEFIRETESAQRAVQQRMLAANARAVAKTISQYREEYPERVAAATAADQLFSHALAGQPRIDGYFDDWQLAQASLRTIDGIDGRIRMAVGHYNSSTYVYVEVVDRDVIYASPGAVPLDNTSKQADRVQLVSSNPPYLEERFVFATEAPGPMQSYKQDRYGISPESAITAYWQDKANGYQLEARIPSNILAPNLGVIVSDTDSTDSPATPVASFTGRTPAPAVRGSRELQDIATTLLDAETRVIVTDTAGWRIAVAGELSAATTAHPSQSGWSQLIYDLLVESGEDAASADPDPSGRERQPYVGAALDGREMSAWFRSENNGRAIVASAAPIEGDNAVIGAVVLQQGTDAILSLTNAGLVRLINMTLIVTVLVAGILLGYATWLSRRIRHLSKAAESALENEALHSALPSALAGDEIGDLSRSFSHVLQQLGDYNAYLRSLASKLSHELRTPLAIVTSSLENLEQEQLSETSSGYTTRALDGAARLRGILTAMSEASRVEELMENADSENFDLLNVLQSATSAYSDAYASRLFNFESDLQQAPLSGSPELLVQMLDKLVDNAVSFSQEGELIRVSLHAIDSDFLLSVANPGPPLPESMRSQLFDSMVAVREDKDSRHLGLGLFVAKLIAEGHGGSISARNTDDGVSFDIRLPRQDSR